jgi:hypothetical protein
MEDVQDVDSGSNVAWTGGNIGLVIVGWQDGKVFVDLFISGEI